MSIKGGVAMPKLNFGIGSFEEINIEMLVPFAKHPFKPYEGQRFVDMVESIRESGVITPIIIRPTSDGKCESVLG